MPTYEEQLHQLQTEIDTATEKNQLLEVCRKQCDLVELYLDSGFGLMAEMNHADAPADFNAAYEAAIVFKRDYQALIDSKSIESPEEQEQLKQLYDLNEVNVLIAEAYYYFNLATYNNINRNPGTAANYYEKAMPAFNNLADVSGKINYSIFASYCNALKYFAEGIEEFFRAGFANAKSKLQRSKILLDSLISKDLEQLKEKDDYKEFYDNSINLFKSDYQSVKSYYFISEAKYQFNNRNFKNALKQFTNVVAEFDLSVKNYLISPGNESLKNLTLGEYNNYYGWKLLAEAEVWRESENWSNAYSNYEAVKKAWEDASDYYLQSGLPSASALQESILNTSATIDVYQAVCENEQELKEKISALQKEIDELKEKLYNAIKPMGVVINNTQDVVTTVEQNAQFIQNIETNAREGIAEFLGMLKDSGLDLATKTKIETSGNDVLASPEKGTKFLDKVKNFTKEVAEVIKNVGDIATPILGAYKFLALLL